MMKSVLVIDDDAGHRLMVRAVLEDAGWQVLEAASGEEGADFFSRNCQYAHVALVDMNMPGMDGHATLSRLHEILPGLPVVLLTAYGTVGSAVEAMKRGAFDYLAKPADNDELVLTLNRAYEYSRLREENAHLRSELSGENACKPLVGSSGPMRLVHDFIRQAGPSEATVLITGESGTGKELIADSLHACSSRSKKPIIKVNCAALPAQLLESELFGYERGAFTGAVKDKPGRFQLASGGTLFLDEIGEFPLDLQAKLLRAIQDRVIEPLGSVRSVPVDVRILVATNRNLRQSVAEGTFREDLFFRLNVLEIESPPLRTRIDDLPLLVSHLLGILSAKNKKEVRGVSPAFLRYLSVYPWPGNVRELENVLERSLILSRSDVLDIDSLSPQLIQYAHADRTPRDGDLQSGQASRHPEPMPLPTLRRDGISSDSYRLFPASDSGTATPSPGKATSPLEEAERNALVQALRMYQGHREKTADALGISRRTLQYKIKKFGLARRG
jgi:two-component system NtrC family response regulator